MSLIFKSSRFSNFFLRQYSFIPKIPSISPNNITHPDLVLKEQACVGISKSELSDRRHEIGSMMENDSVLHLVSPPLQFLAAGVMNSWRQSSNLYYLTGSCEPGASFFMVKDSNGNVTERFFVNEGQGDLYLTNSMGVELSKEIYGIENTHSIYEFDEIWSTELEEYTFFNFETGEREILRQPIFYEENVPQQKLEQQTNSKNRNVNLLIQKLRKVKSENEVDLIRKSMEITTESFNEILQGNLLKPGMNERELDVILDYEMKMRGSQRGHSFIPVIASGVNSTFIHYIFNNHTMNDGELVVVDAGCDYYMYVTDITRTWPVNGTFSEPQKQVYEAVLETNKQIIEIFHNNNTPFETPDDLDHMSLQILANECLERGIFDPKKVELDDVLKNWKKFQPHSTTHFMGIDIHEEDCVSHRNSSKSTSSSVFEIDSVFTVEPGLYFSPTVDYSELGLDEKYLGIGVRIEDDLVVGNGGKVEVLSKNIPKEVDEIQYLMKN